MKKKHIKITRFQKDIGFGHNYADELWNNGWSVRPFKWWFIKFLIWQKWF
jgi:hypothetical protein